MKHRFYAKNQREQTKLQALIAAVAFVIVVQAAVVAAISKIYLIADLIPFLMLRIDSRVYLTFSFTKNQLSFPKLSASNTLETKLADLALRKAYFNQLKSRLKK